ncbi:hypothetical protein BFW01_g4329 [Lasiodiplodia theobromae]|nr:Fas1 domain-containing protein [Lasiodiplodia theobromae]KAF4538349.1 Fas1 domain-containing protein [Lasiodiplodia theobromae]KAF9633435.1 hypothetical protein BFW01_g4329 [Lasiodiplodia theobromae]
MRHPLLLGSLLAYTLFFGTSARAGPLWREKLIDVLDQVPSFNIPSIAMPPGSSSNDAPILSDVVGKDRSINIFSGFTRDVDSVAARLNDGSQNATILAPDNSAIHALPRKPWEDPREYESLGANAYEGADGSSRAQKNLERFVNAHIIPESPWKENHKIQSLGGNTVWYEIKDGKKMLQPGDIEVSSIADKVANGEIWIIKGVLNYA